MTPSTQPEIERKYDVDADTPLPDWSGMPGVARIGEDQVSDYAARRGVDLERAERLLRPNLD